MAKTPTHNDVLIGAKVRLRRKELGLSQQKLAATLGITFQQIQKYEKGTNRIGASRLQHISRILQVPISFFFDGAPEIPGQKTGKTEMPSPAYVSDFLASPDGLALTKAFTDITDSKLRRRLVDLVEEIAAVAAADRAKG